MASQHFKLLQKHYPDEHLLYWPAWRSRLRRFVNFSEKEAKDFNDLIGALLPKKRETLGLPWR